MASSGPAGRAEPKRGALYGGMPTAPGPAGMAPRLLELADELRNEGMAVGTSELLDAFGALDAVSWTSREDFFEALSATLAKSQDDRRVLELVFERFFFRAVEREAAERGVKEGAGEEGGPAAEAERMDLDALRERIRDALRGEDGSDGELRDLAPECGAVPLAQRVEVHALGLGGGAALLAGALLHAALGGLALHGACLLYTS